MYAQLRVERHPAVDRVVQTLPQSLADSFNLFEKRLECNGDLSAFINTPPFSPGDNVGKRTRIEHYHLLPCKPVCYLVGLVRSVDTAYILDVFVHPTQGTFSSPEIEERLYSRLADICPELGEYKLSGALRSGFPVHKKDGYRAGSMNGVPLIAPVRTSDSDYIPLGRLNELAVGHNRVCVVVGSFDVPEEAIPEGAKECFDCEDHPDREALTLYIGGWQCYSGIYRKETEQVVLWLCQLHNVVIQVSNRKIPVVVALDEQDYQQLVENLKAAFPSAEGREQELGEIVDGLIRHFPLHRA